MIIENNYIASTELSHRKKYAQFFTPETIADFMAQWILEGGNVKSVLEDENKSLYLFNGVGHDSFFVDEDILFAYLLTDMAYQIFLDNSRQYGNGLVKFEPNDLNKAKVVDLGLLSEVEKKEIKRLYHAYKTDEDKKYIDAIEHILMDVYAST